MQGLKNTCFTLWQSNMERKGIREQFRPLFVRFIGVQEPKEYDNIIKTIQVRVSENESTSVLFDSEVPMVANFDLINIITKELETMDVLNIKNEDIILFDDMEKNKKFIAALNYILQIALPKENFFNKSQEINFICKLIVWAYTYIYHIKESQYYNPKCIYYGTISKHEIYFLMLLSKMQYDVIYINPASDCNFTDVDTQGLSILKQEAHIAPTETLSAKAARGTVIAQVQSATLQFEQDIEQELFSGTGSYRPWQFREGTTNPVFYNSSIHDIEANFQEQARLRTGFYTKDKTVTVPYLFHVIDGEYQDINKYSNLVSKLANNEKTILSINENEKLYDLNVNPDDKYKLMFCRFSDGTYNPDEIKKLEFYKYTQYKPEVQNLIIQKINEIILNPDVFAFNMTDNEILDLTMILLNLDKKVIRAIDSFDFVEYTPKLVVFIEEEQHISKQLLLLIGFLTKIGFDIIIFNPAGMFSPSAILNMNYINTTRLDNINYNRTYSSLKSKQEKKGIHGMFNKLFN